MGFSYVLPDLPYLALRFRLEALRPAKLPTFKGSMLRGGFGKALRRTVCTMGPKQPCESCLLNRQCPNTQIFETLIHDQAPPFLEGLKQAPRPFIILCDNDQSDFAPGETFTFSLRLLGSATQLYPFVVVAAQRMAANGLGSRRSAFKCLSVEVDHPSEKWQLLLEGRETQLKLQPQVSNTLGTPFPEIADSLTLSFVTPTRLKFNGEYSTTFTSRQLTFAMLRRVLELAYFYMPEAALDWDIKAMLNAASNIEIVERQLTWVDHHRFSYRQKADLFYGGFTGQLTVKGDLKPFEALLKSAMVLNVGKATTFGFGRVKAAKSSPVVTGSSRTTNTNSSVSA